MSIALPEACAAKISGMLRDSTFTVGAAAYECNGQPVSAEAFYAIACDPRRSVAVEACAGAGKTWMLVSRILRALLESDGDVQPHEILAITFTKKAAGEMRERLYDWLEQFALADDETLRRELVLRGVSSQNSSQSSPELRNKLSNLYQRVLESGRTVQIRTFHSWFAALLRSAPLSTLQGLDLPVHYELLEDDTRAKALIWRRFYAALVAQPALKADFEAVVLAHGRFQADKALQGALDKRTEFALADAAGVVEDSVQHFSQLMPQLAGLESPELALDGEASCERWRALGRRLAVEKNKTPQKAALAISAALECTSLTDRLECLRKGFFVADENRLTHNLKPFAAAQEAALELQLLCEAHAQHQAWTYQQRLARLARLLLAEFKELKHERGWIDMNDVERAALDMLGDPVLSGWVQERLDARIRHLLIDEFQDTNPLQWQALSAWLSSYGGAGRAPSVFIVGDPKQSIYRFRRAEPQVFVAAQAFIREGLGGDLLACDHTWRNSAAVMQTINAVMSDARDQDGFTGFRVHSSASQESGSVVRLPPIRRLTISASASHDGTAVAPWRDSLLTPRELPEETLRTQEARQAASWIAQQLESGLKPFEIMVLSRKRAGLVPLQQELRALHIPSQIGEKTELIDCCEVLDLVALLDVLVSPQHDLSLARALRSPLFDVSNEALVQLALAHSASQLSWFEVLQKKELLPPELFGLGAVLIRYKDWVDRLPPHDALQAIYQDGDVLARFAAAAPGPNRDTVLANLRALLSAALQLEGGRYATPYAFVRALKAGGLQAPAAVNPDAVRLLTIHGAKGLEAPAVLLLDTDTPERNLDSMSVLVDWPGEATAPQKFLFLTSESRPPVCAHPAMAAELAARQREELNALYVAMTRAGHTLALSSIEPHHPTTRSWWQRLQALATELPSPLDRSADDHGKHHSAAPVSFELPDLPDIPLLPQTALAVAQEDSPSARIGKAMHRLLEWHGSHDPAGLDAILALAARLGREFHLTPEQVAQAQAMASRIQSGQGSWAWDAGRLAWQGNEVELLHDGETLRLDRLVQRQDAGHAGQWWVLDYKSATAPQHQAALVAQMRSYRTAVQAIYPGAPVRAAFLTGDGALVEID